MTDKSDSEQFDDIITLYGGWKGETLTRLRVIFQNADPDGTVAVKWRMATRPEGLPVWYHNGIMCLAETFKDNIKLVFTKGALMKDPHNLFNARLKSKTDRAIEIHDGDNIDEAGITDFVRQAIDLNNQ